MNSSVSMQGEGSIFQDHDVAAQLNNKNTQKLIDKLAKAKTRRIFLLKCKQYRLCPTFLKLKTDHIVYDCGYLTDKYEKLKNNFIFRTINLLITDTTKIINRLEGKIHTILNEFENIKGKNSRNIQERHVNHKLKYTIDQHKTIHDRKIQKMINSQKNCKQINKETTRIVNLTQTKLPEFVTETLNLGPKYAIEVDREREIPVFDIIAQIESSIEELPREDQDHIRTNITQTLNTYKKQLKGRSQKKNIVKSNFMKTKTFLKNNNDLQVIRADKGNKVVIITKDEYNKKMQELLDDKTTYKGMKRDMTVTMEKKNNKIVKDWLQEKYITAQEAKTMIVHNSKISKMYGLPKVHKENIPLRPIVSFIQSPLYKLSKYMANILSKVTNTNPYYIKNSFHLKESLKNIKIQNDHRLYSLDVKSLYTNIPIDLTKQAIEKNWEKISQFTKIPKEKFIETIQFIMNNSYFQYEDSFYKQIKGVAMGNPVSSPVAQLVMELIEEKIMEQYGTTFYKRYVDDGIIITTPDEITKILHHFNNIHESLEFTLEEESNNSINFLDMTIVRGNGELLTQWYRKEQNSIHILDFNSNHHQSQKKSRAIGYIDRALKLTSPVLRERTLTDVEELLFTNNYPKIMVQKLIKQRTHRLYNTQEKEKSTTDNTKRIPLPFIQGLSQKINNIMKPFKRELVHKPQNQIGQIFSKIKASTPKMKKSQVIYSVPCRDCDKQYIGQTSQRLQDRLNAHKYTKNASTALNKHKKTQKHDFNYEDTKILAIEPQQNKREILEMIHIQMADENTVNDRLDTKI
ncbi:uncharacterized protein LOC123317762 [Coccinella septempunctata]|uniref:uncharacterized protein LOC123317762 n=1 Tax=Coccinella septempunctata TaxID=41139 RepID=UPI001D06A295|nr:uncharacterized protein LOC123317762 [Coccinella septempunctata]